MINQVLSHVTYVDRTQAFLLYTVDKIVASLIKQVGILFFLYRSTMGSEFGHGLAAYSFIFCLSGANDCVRQQVPGVVAVP